MADYPEEENEDIADYLIREENIDGEYGNDWTYESDDEYEMEDTNPDEEKENAGGKKKRAKWKPLPWEPTSYELYPCPHKYLQKHPAAAPKFKKIRAVARKFSQRMDQLALPLCSRVIWLWLDFSDKFEPEKRHRLMTFIMENYGVTEEFLEAALVKYKAKLEEEEYEAELYSSGERGMAEIIPKGLGRIRGRSSKDRKVGHDQTSKPDVGGTSAETKKLSSRDKSGDAREDRDTRGVDVGTTRHKPISKEETVRVPVSQKQEKELDAVVDMDSKKHGPRRQAGQVQESSQGNKGVDVMISRKGQRSDSKVNPKKEEESLKPTQGSQGDKSSKQPVQTEEVTVAPSKHPVQTEEVTVARFETKDAQSKKFNTKEPLMPVDSSRKSKRKRKEVAKGKKRAGKKHSKRKKGDNQKKGRLGRNWPFKVGTEFVMKMTSILTQDTDEDFNSRASEYFDVQSMAILEQVCLHMGKPLPDAERMSQYEETLVLMSLNLADLIAKHVVVPARAIPDEMVDDLLALRGSRPKPHKSVKGQKGKKGKRKKRSKKMGKKKGSRGKNKRKMRKGKKRGRGKNRGKRSKKDKSVKNSTPASSQATIQRDWEEVHAPVFVPQKGRHSKRPFIKMEDDSDVPEYFTMTKGSVMEDNMLDAGFPETLQELYENFVDYMRWYDPAEPEFMFLGPRVMPDGVHIFNILDNDSQEVPEDLRVLNWNLSTHGYIDDYSFIPFPVPEFYPTLRPLRPVPLLNLESSGIPREILKRNLRYFSPWYLPNGTPYKHRDTSMLDDGIFGEAEEIEPTMPSIRDSTWGDEQMKEQVEIICRLLQTMATTPGMTLDYMFEQLGEFEEAVTSAELDENSSDANRLINKKRTIILEQYFVDYFGVAFRDYNVKTSHFMRVLCSRAVYLIQLLYEHTARVLWGMQSLPNPHTPAPSRPVTPDDPQALQDWDKWLSWLLNVCRTCDDWSSWIMETVHQADKMAAMKMGEVSNGRGETVVLTTSAWREWKKSVEDKIVEYKIENRNILKEHPYFMEKAQQIMRVKHRIVKKPLAEWQGESEEYEEENYEDEELDEENEDLEDEIKEDNKEYNEVSETEEIDTKRDWLQHYGE